MTNPDALSASIPDPEEDFEGCINTLAELAIDQLRLEIPAGLPTRERRRRLVLRGAKRLIRVMETEHMPWRLVELQLGALVRAIGNYCAIHECDP